MGVMSSRANTKNTQANHATTSEERTKPQQQQQRQQKRETSSSKPPRASLFLQKDRCAATAAAVEGLGEAGAGAMSSSAGPGPLVSQDDGLVISREEPTTKGTSTANAAAAPLSSNNKPVLRQGRGKRKPKAVAVGKKCTNKAKVGDGGACAGAEGVAGDGEIIRTSGLGKGKRRRNGQSHKRARQDDGDEVRLLIHQ